jgi:hypothetical protein
VERVYSGKEIMAAHKEYIGDGVYASFDGFQIWLESGSNRIALEPGVFRSLILYSDSLNKKLTEMVGYEVKWSG